MAAGPFLGFEISVEFLNVEKPPLPEWQLAIDRQSGS
jgi:hypothetical protein